MWIKVLNMTIKKCRVTSDKITFWNNPKRGGRALHYGYHNNNIPSGQDKFTDKKAQVNRVRDPKQQDPNASDMKYFIQHSIIWSFS
jgi:hypothetical protein